MKTIPTKQKEEPEVAALRLACQLRGWDYGALAEKLGVSRNHVRNQFANGFSAKSMRLKVNQVFGEAIFKEGVA